MQPGQGLSCSEQVFILDRKSTRLNSSHLVISYAVFCLKKKNIKCRHASHESAGHRGHLGVREAGMRSMAPLSCVYFFFFNDTATTEIYTLSLHDALPI